MIQTNVKNKLKMPQKLPKSIRPEEFKKLSSILKPNDKVGKTAFILSYGAGLRISEVVGLTRWKSKCCNANVGKEKVKGLIRYSCIGCSKELKLQIDTRRAKHGEWEIPPLEKSNFQDDKIKVFGKGSKERIVPIPKGWKQYMYDLLPIKKTSRALEKKFKNYAKKAELNPEYTYHSLRHGFATRCHENKMPLSHIQYLLGHSNLSTTSIYVKASGKDALESYEEYF